MIDLFIKDMFVYLDYKLRIEMNPNCKLSTTLDKLLWLKSQIYRIEANKEENV